VLRRRRSGCRPRRRAPRAGRALSDFGDVSTVSVLRDVVKDGQGRTRSLERPRRQCGGARFRHLSRHALPMGSPWRESAVATPTRRAVDGSPGQGSAGRFFAGCQLSRRLLGQLPRPGTAGVSPLHRYDDESALNAVHFALSRRRKP
jgi:hypothetical protein